MTREFLVVALAVYSSCGSSAPSAPEETVCSAAEARLGHRVCVHDVPDAATWTAITYAAAAVDQERATTYLVPARDDARLPALFVDASGFGRPEQSLHFKFLTESFPELRALTYDEYLELVLDHERREWFAGSITEYIAAGRAPVFGFTIADPAIDAATTVTCAQVEEVYGVLAAHFHAGALAAVPSSLLQRAVLEDCGVPWHDPSTALDYEVYTRAKGCGTVRRYTLAELAAAENSAAFGWQDLLVTEEAPLDLATVIAGIVTGTRQGELSHLNVRSASRGTPNCYVRGAHELLAAYEGTLVELTCGATQATVVPLTPEQAEECWRDARPEPVTVSAPDLEWTELVGLLELPTADAAERETALARFGAKGTNLATLYQRIEPALQLAGFLVPMHFYGAFVETNGFSATIESALTDPQFMSDGVVRRQALDALVTAMEDAPCDPALLAALQAKLLAVFGSDDVMVRFRSSSNAEDALGFNGAGLYDSTSVCLADELDDDSAGPSRCDPDEPKERGLCRGLRKVWASLWNLRAYEERDWYGIDQQQVAMGILVDLRVKNELANIVAFSGNPVQAGDTRYLVNAQLGELDVVSAVSGVWPEKDLLTVDGGEVTLIERVRGSTELSDGEWVLDDALLRELGAQLARIVAVYPLDEAVPVTARVLLDTEWKLRADGQLIIKQVRPYLE